jgi:hypothetical protein
VSAHGCCKLDARRQGYETIAARTAEGGAHRSTLADHCLATAACVVPGALLALLPKCPACLAAYVAIGTGVGLSISTAAQVRTLLVIGCAALLSWLAAGRLRR